MDTTTSVRTAVKPRETPGLSEEFLPLGSHQRRYPARLLYVLGFQRLYQLKAVFVYPQPNIVFGIDSTLSDQLKSFISLYPWHIDLVCSVS